MPGHFPGTVIETSKLSEDASRTLFNGIFAGGGIALSQVSSMTGLEPHVIQNWVKRGFVTSPVKRTYSPKQFARIIIINMLRQTMQIEQITGLLSHINGVLSDESDDMIADDELYHLYVGVASVLEEGDVSDSAVSAACENAAADYAEPQPGARQKLCSVLQIMAYAHIASVASRRSLELLSSLG